MQIEIPRQVDYIIGKLKRHGYEAYAVGGCVRDTLLGRTPGDWDITTSARPVQVKELFRRTIDTGIQHGTVTVLVDRVGYEVTTYRIDGEYEDGRHPKQVQFTSDLLEDLRRRDFTINAIAYSPETGIVDAFDGAGDLKRRVIRCVGDPTERFTEDALRILRAIRFSAQLDFTIDPVTREAIRTIAPNLAKVSKERIQAELTKTLLSGCPEKIKDVYETGISEYVSPSFSRIPWEDIRIPAGLPEVRYLRWAALLRLVSPEEAVRILKDLKMDNETIAHVRTLTSWAGKPMNEDEVAVRRAMSQMEPQIWDALIELNEYGENIRRLTARIRERGDCLTLRQLAVTGQDLILAGVKPGREIGVILSRMLDAVLEDPSKNDKKVLMDFLAETDGKRKYDEKFPHNPRKTLH
ncbi:MAG: CCA tRNA nucleotidyltransferase [Clostridiales bacterium]|nr:CCA tRNA nucleotidyltransferase [Clostridiales bacterium]